MNLSNGRRRAAWVLALLALTACTNFTKKLAKVSPNDTKSQVADVMGDPDDVQFNARQGLEVWQYFGVVSFGSCDYRQLWFREGRLVGSSSYRSGCAGGCSPCLRNIDWRSPPDTVVEVRHR